MRNGKKLLIISMTSVLLFSGTLGIVSACGTEGLTPGFWKNRIEFWPTGYTAEDPGATTLSDKFNVPYSDLADDTFLEALNYKGFGGPDGAAKNLLKHAVAALLNAAHPDIDYPYTKEEIITMVNAALVEDRDSMLDLKDKLDEANNLGAVL